MTPSTKYRIILQDVTRFLHARSQRYFEARHAGEPEDLLKVQCDTVMDVLKTYIEPHLAWFEQYEEAVHESCAPTAPHLLTVDLEPEITGETDAHD